jgi:2-oxoglutarate ferredoxin oxidoreductase subunit delta
MPHIVIDVEKCRGCALCTTACPRKLLSLAEEKFNGKGFHPVEINNPSLCTGCAMCARMCPDISITVYK